MVSVFGAMFAPKPLDVAKEAVSVTKAPADGIVMGTGSPAGSDTVAQILRISSPHRLLLLRRNFVEPDDLGEEENAIQPVHGRRGPRDKYLFQP